MTATLSAFEPQARDLLLSGAPDAAAGLVLGQLGPGVLRYLSSMLPRDDAQDAFSEWQLALWRGLPGFRWECPLRAWAYRLARHAAAHVAGDAFRRRRVPLLPNAEFDLPFHDPHEATMEDRSAQYAALRRALGREERRLLALRVARALPWNEVAAILKSAGYRVSCAGLRKRFERLKLKLAGLARAQGLVA